MILKQILLYMSVLLINLQIYSVLQVCAWKPVAKDNQFWSHFIGNLRSDDIILRHRLDANEIRKTLKFPYLLKLK